MKKHDPSRLELRGAVALSMVNLFIAVFGFGAFVNTGDRKWWLLVPLAGVLQTSLWLYARKSWRGAQ